MSIYAKQIFLFKLFTNDSCKCTSPLGSRSDSQKCSTPMQQRPDVGEWRRILHRHPWFVICMAAASVIVRLPQLSHLLQSSLKHFDARDGRIDIASPHHRRST